jgi:hypothetical protein
MDFKSESCSAMLLTSAVKLSELLRQVRWGAANASRHATGFARVDQRKKTAPEEDFAGRMLWFLVLHKNGISGRLREPAAKRAAEGRAFSLMSPSSLVAGRRNHRYRHSLVVVICATWPAAV